MTLANNKNEKVINYFDKPQIKIENDDELLLAQLKAQELLDELKRRLNVKISTNND